MGISPSFYLSSTFCHVTTVYCVHSAVVQLPGGESRVGSSAHTGWLYNDTGWLYNDTGWLYNDTGWLYNDTGWLYNDVYADVY